MNFYLGIDVSKTKLDCALLDARTGKYRVKVVDNTKLGFAALLVWIAKQKAEISDVHILMEATGVYHEAAALAFADAGVLVSLANPLHVRRFAESLGLLNKTDSMDAAMLARFAKERQPEPWQPPSQAVRELNALLGRRDAVAEDLQREKNRLEQASAATTPTMVLDSLDATLEHLQKQLDALDEAIDEHIDNDPDLKNNRDLLLSIPGVGIRVANRFTALLSDRRFKSAEQLAAYLGLVPIHWESGISVKAKARMSKKGPAKLRALLYLPAVVAKRYNPHVKAVYERMLAGGKSKMAAVGAAMRKLAHLCYGVVSSGVPYDASWQPDKA